MRGFRNFALLPARSSFTQCGHRDGPAWLL